MGSCLPRRNAFFNFLSVPSLLSRDPEMPEPGDAPDHRDRVPGAVHGPGIDFTKLGRKSFRTIFYPIVTDKFSFTINKLFLT
jgi:hypothetical protein